MHKVYQLAKLHTTNQHHSMCQPAVATLEPVHSCDASAETQTHCIASKQEKQKRASNPLGLNALLLAPPVEIEPTTLSVRNIVVLLAWSASQDSLFLPAQALPTPAAGGGNA